MDMISEMRSWLVEPEDSDDEDEDDDDADDVGQGQTDRLREGLPER